MNEWEAAKLLLPLPPIAPLPPQLPPLLPISSSTPGSLPCHPDHLESDQGTGGGFPPPCLLLVSNPHVTGSRYVVANYANPACPDPALWSLASEEDAGCGGGGAGSKEVAGSCGAWLGLDPGTWRQGRLQGTQEQVRQDDP